MSILTYIIPLRSMSSKSQNDGKYIWREPGRSFLWQLMHRCLKNSNDVSVICSRTPGQQSLLLCTVSLWAICSRGHFTPGTFTYQTQAANRSQNFWWLLILSLLPASHRGSKVSFLLLSLCTTGSSFGCLNMCLSGNRRTLWLCLIWWISGP